MVRMIAIGGRLGLVVLTVFAIAGCGGAAEDLSGSGGGGGVTPGTTVVPTTQTPGGATPTTTPIPGAPASLHFVSAGAASIGVRNSGLAEQTTLTFQVSDKLSVPVPGVPVMFSASTVADESIATQASPKCPTNLTAGQVCGVTDSSGNVRVTLTSGRRAVSVQITATVLMCTGAAPSVSCEPTAVSARSTPVDILGAPPSQLHFSVNSKFLNISGRVTFGLENEVTAYVGDRFGNPVPPGTAVSFTTNKGLIGSPATTNGLGQAGATLISQQPAGLGPNDSGIVSTLATTHGERPFEDANHNGVCDSGEVDPEKDLVSEPYYDANCNGQYDEGEDFIDLNNNQMFDADQVSVEHPACDDPIVIFNSVCSTFSAGTQVQLIPDSTGPIAAGGGRSYTLTIDDRDQNSIVGGSTVSIAVQGRMKLLGPATFDIPDAITLGQLVPGVNLFSVEIVDNAPNSTTAETDVLTVTVTSAGLPAGGNGSIIVTDIVTFFPAGVPVATPTPGAAGSLHFVGASTSTIGVRGSGLPEQTTLTFQVTDAVGAPVEGEVVHFAVSGVADATIATISKPCPSGHVCNCSPDRPCDVTDSSGNVRVTVTSGERALSVQVTATVEDKSGNDTTLTVRSTPVDVLGAPPSQLHFSINPEFLNISGRVTFGLQNKITAFVGDRFGNPVPPDTAVSFTTDKGLIGSPVTTSQLGQAVATLVSQRPLGPNDNGIVATLGTTHGERPFEDNNHNGVCDPGEVDAQKDLVSEPYYDANCNGQYDEGENFIDLNNNNQFDTDQAPPGQAACGDPIVVFDSLCTTFSGNTVVQLIPSPTGLIPAGGRRDYTMIISDAQGNPIVGGSKVAITTQGRMKLLGPATFSIPDAQTFGQLVDGVTLFSFSIVDSQPTSTTSETDALIVTVTSEDLPAGGNVSVITTDEMTFLPAGVPAVTPTPGQPTALHFVSAQPTAIGVKGSGLPEQSTLTFQVTDVVGAPVAGTVVSFGLSMVADESIATAANVQPCPAGRVCDISDSNGNVNVTLTSGARALTVQINARVESAPSVTAQSTAVAIFGAPPVQSRFGIAATLLNVPGRVLFGVQDPISIYANDRFGNAVPSGTAITFTSSGASVVSQATTNGSGVATATLLTENNIPPTGIVTVMAYTRGEETFQDNNGNGVYDPGIDTLTGDNESEPFIDFRPLPASLAPQGPNDASCPIAPRNPKCNGRFDAGAAFESFIDANNDGLWDTQGTSGQWDHGDNSILIFTSIPVTFSGRTVPPVASPQSFRINEGGEQTFTLEVHDDLLNPLVGGSTISIASSSNKVKVTPATITVPDGESFNQLVPGLTTFQFVVSDAADDMNPTAAATTIIVTITSQNGSGSFPVASGVVDIFLTPTPTTLPTPTPTTLPPAIAPGSAVLSAGDGAPPNSCNGGIQTFVVTGGSPPFAVAGGGGCVSVASVPVSGGQVTYTAGNTPGHYALIVTDAIGRTASVNINISGPPTATPANTPTPPPPPTTTATKTATWTATMTPTPTPSAAHVVLALFVKKSCDNGDGTLSTLLNAVVTDINGFAIGDGVPVQFSQVPPVVSGVAFTSGVTGGSPPCSLSCLSVVQQPGDAFGCIKYDQRLAGLNIIVQASVPEPSGTPIATVTPITLP